MVIRSTVRVTSEDMPRPSQSPYNPPPARVQRAWDSPTATIADKLAARLWSADTLATLQWARHDVDLACALGIITPRQATRIRAITTARSLVLATGRWRERRARVVPNFLCFLRLTRFLRTCKVVKGW